LVAQFLDERGVLLAALPLQTVDPAEPIELNRVITVPATAASISLHVLDRHGVDRGPLGEARIKRSEGGL
jgi:hypothetical protein